MPESASSGAGLRPLPAPSWCRPHPGEVEEEVLPVDGEGAARVTARGGVWGSGGCTSGRRRLFTRATSGCLGVVTTRTKNEDRQE